MFPFPIAKPQGCDIQTFYGPGPASVFSEQSWTKPRGVSHVYMMLIGPGGNGDNTTGGGSGAVTVWYGAAQHVPDVLLIAIGVASDASYVCTRQSNGINYLLQAGGGGVLNGTPGYASTPGRFAASGFYQSVDGQPGTASSVSVSPTTFLTGGAAGNATTITANYGYGLLTGSANTQGQFQRSPIIVGVGGKNAGTGGIGCGGGHAGGKGGQGMVLIASW